MKKFLTQNLIAVFMALLTGSCGNLSLTTGTTASPNAPTPAGTMIAQGQFFGQNGQNVSGSAAIYYLNGAYTLYIQGISAPSEVGLLLQVYASPTGLIFNQTLQASRGSQDYSLSNITYGMTLNTVYIYSSITQRYYGSAQLIQTKR